MEQPARRSTASVVGICLFVLAVAIGGAVLARQLGSDEDESHPGAGEYESVGVPWWDGRAGHWSGHSTRLHGEVASMTATEEAAAFLHDRRGPEYDDDDGFVAPGRATLTALFADGTVEELDTEVLGVPLADPTGHLVAWTTRAGNGTARVTAYDTAERVVLGSQTLHGDFAMVTAVVGETVYLATGKEALAWEPRAGKPPRVVDGPGGWSVVLGVADDGLLVMGEEFGVRWVGTDGGEQRLKQFLGSISPNGQYVATVSRADQHRRDVLELLSGDRIDLELPEDKQAYAARWAGDGTLVVAAVARADVKDGWDDAFPVVNYACAVPEGDCRALEGGPAAIYHLPVYEDSSYGVLMIWLEGIGS